MRQYQPPFFLVNGHLETIFPAMLRQVRVPLAVTSERITTPDDDFLDLDWYITDSPRLIIISHGLEGNSRRGYMLGMARAMVQQGYNVLCWNYRGCSGEMNRQRRFYHSGATEDLDIVVQHALSRGYARLALIGFSLGGNLTLKYLGEQRRPAQIEKAVAFSTPVDLGASCDQISLPSNRIYANRFLKSLKHKVTTKAQLRGEPIPDGLGQITSLRAFDDIITGPLHGFRDAADYYHRCSSVNFFAGISIPTLLVNARNDPFLNDACFPVERAASNPFITFEAPSRGGHVGFAQYGQHGLYWSEERAHTFLAD